jgi:hypothetical protein
MGLPARFWVASFSRLSTSWVISPSSRSTLKQNVKRTTDGRDRSGALLACDGPLAGDPSFGLGASLPEAPPHTAPNPEGTMLTVGSSPSTFPFRRPAVHKKRVVQVSRRGSGVLKKASTHWVNREVLAPTPTGQRVVCRTYYGNLRHRRQEETAECGGHEWSERPFPRIRGHIAALPVSAPTRAAAKKSIDRICA